MQTVPAHAAPMRKHNESRLILPLANPLEIQMTDDEARRGCVFFLLPASMIGLDTAVYAVCEPVTAWQWLTKEELVVHTTYYEYENEEENGPQISSVTVTGVSRVDEVCRKKREITFAPESDWEHQGWDIYPVEDILGLWKVGRVVKAQAPMLQKAA